MFFLFLKPKSKTSTGEPSTKACVVVVILVFPIVAFCVASTAFSPPIALAILSCFIVLRAFSLVLLNSSTVSPLLIANLWTKPWILSISWTCKLICFYRTTKSLSILIFMLCLSVSIFASNCINSFFWVAYRVLLCLSAFSCLNFSTLSASSTSNSLSSLR